MKASVLDYLKLRVLSFYHEAMMLKQGKMPAPRMCILYPTYACDQRCIGCDYTEMNKTGRSLTGEEFDYAIKELISIGIKSVEFCGGGEATLHPYLPQAMDKFINNGIAFGLLTNGTNLTDELKRRLVEHGSYCRVSVEAGSREVFDRYKRPQTKRAGFDNVIKNISDIVALRDARRSGTNLQICYKYAVDMNNYEDIINAIELAYGLKVDAIQFKCIRNVPSELKDQRIIGELKEAIQREKAKYPGFRIDDNLDKSLLKKCRCWLSEFQLTVDPFGDVFICCYYRHRVEEHRLGNLLSQSLKDIWYSQEHWYKTSQIDSEECNRYDCRFHYYNELMYDLVIQDAGQLYFI